VQAAKQSRQDARDGRRASVAHGRGVRVVEDSVQLAESGPRGILIFAQGDPDFEGKMRRKRSDGFTEFRNALRGLALRFGKPVLFVNGDTHLYKLDQPLADPATGDPSGNFTRVVVFGSPQTRWIRAG